MLFGNVVFTDEYIVYSDGSEITVKDFDGNIVEEEIYSCEDGEKILDIYMITNNNLQIRITEYEEISKTYIYNFTYNTLKENSENYYDILNIK